MKKMEAYRWLGEQSRELGFLANVILCQHVNPARKLKGVVKVVQAGLDIRVGNEIDIILIEGERIGSAVLEEFSKKAWSVESVKDAYRPFEVGQRVRVKESASKAFGGYTGVVTEIKSVFFKNKEGSWRKAVVMKKDKGGTELEWWPEEIEEV